MDTPVALHLDHGKKFEDVKNAIRAGFTSVMIDGASFNFEKTFHLPRRRLTLQKHMEFQ